MPHPFPMASVFTEGMRRDSDRTMLPGGSVWNLLDFIPDEIQAAASGRGGWTYAGNALSGATKIQEVAFHPDTGKVVALDSAKKLWDVAAATSIAATLTTNVPTTPPFYHRGKLIFGQGNVVPAYYDSGGTTGTLAAAPKINHGVAYKDHSCAVGVDQNGANTQRVFFSAAGDPTTWDQTFGYWDTTGIVVGLAATLNAILVFHGDTAERLRGTTPPPGSDMDLEPLYNDGCIDVHTIAYWGQRVLWASSRGIYLTDGVSVVDLTAAAGMKTYWISLLSSYATSWRIAAGVYRDHYIISINNGNTLVDCLCVNLNTRSMWRFTNLHGSGFVNVTNAVAEELYMGQWNAGRVAKLSPLWSPAAGVKQDGDATNPTPIIETGAYRGYDRLHRRWIQSMGLQKWGQVYCDYDLRDAASDNPTITLSYALSPGGSYTALTGGNLAKTTDYTRKRRSVGAVIGGAKRSNMLELKLAVNGPYATANVYTLEAAFEPIDIGRLI